MSETTSILNRCLRKHVAPVLREAGFPKVDARHGWLWQGKVVRVFNIRAVGGYFSDVTGWPPGSVGVYLGSFYTFAPVTGSVKLDSQQRPLPTESQCHMRAGLDCGIDQSTKLQSLLNPAEKKRKDIWWVDYDGLNAEAVARDIANVLHEKGLPWFSRTLNLQSALIDTENERDCYNKFVRAAFLAREIGDKLRWGKYASLAEEEAKRIGRPFDFVQLGCED
jgi:hypothetical protein